MSNKIPTRYTTAHLGLPLRLVFLMQEQDFKLKPSFAFVRYPHELDAAFKTHEHAVLVITESPGLPFLILDSTDGMWVPMPEYNVDAKTAEMLHGHDADRLSKLVDVGTTFTSQGANLRNTATVREHAEKFLASHPNDDNFTHEQLFGQLSTMYLSRPDALAYLEVTKERFIAAMRVMPPPTLIVPGGLFAMGYLRDLKKLIRSQDTPEVLPPDGVQVGADVPEVDFTHERVPEFLRNTHVTRSGAVAALEATEEQFIAAMEKLPQPANDSPTGLYSVEYLRQLKRIVHNYGDTTEVLPPDGVQVAADVPDASFKQLEYPISVMYQYDDLWGDTYTFDCPNPSVLSYIYDKMLEGAHLTTRLPDGTVLRFIGNDGRIPDKWVVMPKKTVEEAVGESRYDGDQLPSLTPVNGTVIPDLIKVPFPAMATLVSGTGEGTQTTILTRATDCEYWQHSEYDIFIMLAAVGVYRVTSVDVGKDEVLAEYVRPTSVADDAFNSGPHDD